MLTKMHNEQKGKFFLCLMAFVFTLMSVCAENLTTLDGKIFTNISDIVKYPNQISFKHNEQRILLAISNLPAEFLSKHGVTIKTNTPKSSAPTQTQVNPTDAFLWQNRGTDLYQIQTDTFSTNAARSFARVYKTWQIQLGKGVDISLSVDSTTYFGEGTDSRIRDASRMEFEIGQEELVLGVFYKFLEWDSIATTNHAENFEKEFARLPASKSMVDLLGYSGQRQCVYTFVWFGGKSQLKVSGDTPYSGNFDKDDVIGFQKLMAQLPTMKEKLVAAIRNKQTQKDLFK